jgi:hypothetical protein
MKIAEGILNAYPKTYEEYVDTKLVGEDGINQLTGKDRDFYLNNPSIKERYDRELDRRARQVAASELQKEGSSLYNAVARFKNEFKELGAMGLAAIDGPGGRFTIKELYDEGDGILGRVAPKLNMDKVREMLGGEPTPEQLRYIEDFYNKNSLASQTGLAAALLTEAVPVTGVGKGIAKGVGKVARKIDKDEIGAVGNIDKLIESKKIKNADALDTLLIKARKRGDYDRVDELIKQQIVLKDKENPLNILKIENKENPSGYNFTNDTVSLEKFKKIKQIGDKESFYPIQEVDVLESIKSGIMRRNNVRGFEVGTRVNPRIGSKTENEKKIIESVTDLAGNAADDLTASKFNRDGKMYVLTESPSISHARDMGNALSSLKYKSSRDKLGYAVGTNFTKGPVFQTGNRSKNYRKLVEGEAEGNLGFYVNAPRSENAVRIKLGEKVSELPVIQVPGIIVQKSGEFKINSFKTPIQLLPKNFKNSAGKSVLTAEFKTGNSDWSRYLDALMEYHVQGSKVNKNVNGSDSIMAHLGMDYTNQETKKRFFKAVEEYFGETPPYNKTKRISYSGKKIKEWKKNPTKFGSTEQAVKEWNGLKTLITKFNKFFPESKLSPDHIFNIARTEKMKDIEKGQYLETKNIQLLFLKDNTALKNRVLENSNTGFGRILKNIEKIQQGTASKKITKLGTDFRSATTKVTPNLQEQIDDFKTLWYRWQDVVADKNIKYTLQGDKKFTKENLKKFLDPNDPILDEIFEKTKVVIDTSDEMDVYISFMEEMIKAKGQADELIKQGVPGAKPFKFKGGGSVRKNMKPGGTTGISEKFTGLSFGFGNIRELQQDIKDLYDDKLSDTIEPIREATEIKVEDVLKDTRTVLNKGDRPIEIRPVTEGYKLFTESPIVRSIIAAPATGKIKALETVESIYNSLRKGTENDIQMEEYFPAVYGLRQFLTESVGETPDDQTYISFIDEVNRAQETGFTRLGYNIVDLASLAPDWTFGTDATDKIKKSYDKMIEEGRITEPETFLGEVGAIGVEFGVPGGAVFKGVNTLRRMIKATTGVNLFAVPTYSLTGGALLGTKISNVAKRVGTTAAVFGGTDFIAGGPYNTVSEVFKDDPLLFDNTLGYDYENTEGLSGKELSVANFKNRLRFGADGAIIGGLFPLVGPPLWYATKNGLLKPGAAVASKTLQLGNELTVKPLSYLASGTLKAPFSAAGKLEVEVPGLREVNQGLAGGTKIFANFLGKDVITRAAVAAMGAKPGLIKQLPDFKDWRMFEVNDADPLKANLKKIDKVFEFFREAGARSPDQLYLDVKTQNFIKSKSRQIEKMLDSVEVKAYDLANGFLKRYNTNKTSPAGQDYLLDQVLSYIKGQIKLSDLPQELQAISKALSEEFDSVRNFYKDVLPDDSGLKQFLTSNLKSYIRQSFGVFTNPQFKVDPELKEKAIDFVVDRIRNNESLVELAIKNSTENTDVAIRNFARQQVDDLLATVKTEGFDPIIQLQKIAKENLKLDDVYVQTGEELPDVIRKLLGEEQGLRSSVMQTTASLVTQAANLKNYDRIGELLLQQGRLFVSRDEAIRAGVVNPVSVGRVPGLGLLDSGITQLYGSKEVTGMLRGSLGQLDKFMESSIYQSMIAYKAGVQTGKTVLSPATQTRNFGSAAAFVLNNGWIGGKASVSDAIKITLDDIFGAGRTFNEEELIKNITRKSELGVIDENIVASELSAVLADIKSGKVGTFGKIAGAADNSKLMKTATRLYSGGDNVWKWYGHEYLKSQLKGAFKNVNEVKKAVRDDFGITEFNPKNMYEAVEEYAGMLVRELMPTYSKVPPMIQAIRKIPFIGNFVSFPAEIIRTSFATSTLAMKHIASNNPTLRAMGYRSLMGQAATLWALNEGARGLGYAMTNITPEQIRTYKDEFAADYMKYSDLIPISNLDEDKGTFKVFDMSRYNPYDLISSTVNNLIVRATDPKAKLDPARIETDVLSEYFGASGPLLDLLNGTLFGLSIGTEGVYEALTGKTKTGSSVWSDSDTALEKFDKGIMHIMNKNEPGVISSAQRVTAALAGDVSGTGQPIELGDEAFKLIGGSTVTVDVPGSFAFKISEFQNTFKDPKVSEGWYSTKNYQQRGPAQLVREYNDMNEEAFREQYRFYKAVQAALNSGLMSKKQIREALENRKIAKSTIEAILRGKYKPLSYGEGGLEARYKKIKEANPDKKFRRTDFLPLNALDRAKRKWEKMKFEDFEINKKEPIQSNKPLFAAPPQEVSQVDVPVPPLPDTGTPEIAPNQMANVSGTAVSPQTGLTNSESVYLSPTEQLYRRKERGLA